VGVALGGSGVGEGVAVGEGEGVSVGEGGKCSTGRGEEGVQGFRERARGKKGGVEKSKKKRLFLHRGDSGYKGSGPVKALRGEAFEKKAA